MKRVVVIGMLLAVGLVGSAQARPFEAPEEVAYLEALAYWGVPPLCGEVVRTVEAPVVEDAQADASQPSGFIPVCFLQIAPQTTEYPGLLCIAMHHEVGHLLGYGHSLDPSSVMSAPPTLATVPRCLELEEAHNAALVQEWKAMKRQRCRNLAAHPRWSKRLRGRIQSCWNTLR